MLFTSLPLLAELMDILARRKFEKKIAMSGLTIDELVSRYTLLAVTTRPASIPLTIRDDPDDDHVLACALAAQANLIVSGDKHLHGLGGSYQGMRIVRPAEAVAMIEAG
jgi:putative PIN family toxin of toxin-antitoxin system